jgi:hypothetical protein
VTGDGKKKKKATGGQAAGKRLKILLKSESLKPKKNG